MDQAKKSSEPKKETSSAHVAPPSVPRQSGRFKAWLAHTGTSLTAEYSIFLILLGVTLSNLAWLVYLFFGLIVDSMTGSAMSAVAPVHMFALWLVISSVVTLPLTYVLWCRIQGELAGNRDYKGDLPKGAARGFRTVWLIVSVLSVAGLLMAALYAPLAAALSGGAATQTLLSVTLPSFINIAVTGAGVYVVTRGTHSPKRSQLLILAVAILTVVLFAVNYVWASSANAGVPDRRPLPYAQPADDYDAYNDIYGDPYYDYTKPSDYR